VPRRHSPERLRRLRNEIDIADLIENILRVPSKVSEGYCRFLCPHCCEFNTATNPRTNLARCFRCELNFNPIDMVMAIRRCSFLEAVRFLSPLLPPRRNTP
jgi:hypothetical protein